MAEMHSRVFGTEDDKDNCSFFHKTGACRHGERCARKHIRPHFSVTVAIPNLYIPPDPRLRQDEQQVFEEFYEDVLGEMRKYGRIDDMIVIENLGEHMNGNLYIKYRSEDESEKAKKALTGRKFAGMLLEPQYSPVTDFKDSRCRQYDDNTCNRGGYCNFMHIRPLPLWLKRELDESGRDRAREMGREPMMRPDREQMSRPDMGREPMMMNRDMGREQMNRPDMGGRDQGRDFGRDQGRDFGRDQGRDFGRDRDHMGGGGRDRDRGRDRGGRDMGGDRGRDRSAHNNATTNRRDRPFNTFNQ